MYLKAIWPDLWGAFLRFGRPRGPGKTQQKGGGRGPPIFEGLPGGPAKPQKHTQKDPARLPSGTQAKIKINTVLPPPGSEPESIKNTKFPIENGNNIEQRFKNS